MELWWLCLNKPLTKVIWCRTLVILGMDLASVHHPGQYLTKIASNLAQTLWFDNPIGIISC